VRVLSTAFFFCLIVLSEVVVIVVVMERKQRRGVRLDDGEEVKLPAQSKNNTEKKRHALKEMLRDTHAVQQPSSQL
jgi:preprotein translocase subunit SecF